MSRIPKWWDDVEFLTRKVKNLYVRLEQNGKSNLVEACTQKIIKERKWDKVRDLIEDNLRQVVAEHGFMYVPKGFEPGPRFVFPQYDLNDIAMKAQTRPLESDVKYWIAGGRENFLGPGWLGTSDRMLNLIMEKKYVMIIEGTFDFIAVRSLVPELPCLCSLTKKIGKKQEAYLRMLGVKDLYLMFDQDEQGKIAMDITKRTFTHMNVDIVKTPTKDASEALEVRRHAQILKETINSITDKYKVIETNNIIILEEE